MYLKQRHLVLTKRTLGRVVGGGRRLLHCGRTHVARSLRLLLFRTELGWPVAIGNVARGFLSGGRVGGRRIGGWPAVATRRPGWRARITGRMVRRCRRYSRISAPMARRIISGRRRTVFGRSRARRGGVRDSGGGLLRTCGFAAVDAARTRVEFHALNKKQRKLIYFS